MKPVVVRNVAIGEAIPKICVPIVGKTIDEILNQAKHICEIGADVVEWRVDWFEGSESLRKCGKCCEAVERYSWRDTDSFCISDREGRWRARDRTR